MKRLFLVAACTLCSLFALESQAQVNIQVNVGQPQWMPSNYQSVKYYYIPEITTYYHVPTRQYIYYDDHRWVKVKKIPKRYRHYNFGQAKKIIVNQDRPYLRHGNQRYVMNYKKYDHPKKNKYKKHRKYDDD